MTGSVAANVSVRSFRQAAIDANCVVHAVNAGMPRFEPLANFWLGRRESDRLLCVSTTQLAQPLPVACYFASEPVTVPDGGASS